MRRIYASALVVLMSAVLAVVGVASPAAAASSQLGESQIVLNPGGGIVADGTDGLQFTINADAVPLAWPYTAAGSDRVRYRDTDQYCCSGGAPMLNIGGVLYGQAGPAVNAPLTWADIDVVSTTGAVAVGAATSATGSASAVVRYTVEHDGLTYVMQRTVSYTYPNDFVTESYTFTIPTGNTAAVRFYLGGDTAPGSSDSGQGVMLTEPVRSVASVNPQSLIQFGFREVPGSKPFDGATAQHYGMPYAAVTSGANIGFIATPATHDAGLMMQWNLGSDPGTQVASMQTFAGVRGVNLLASFGAETIAAGSSTTLDLNLVNTTESPASGVDVKFALPAGLVVEGAAVSTCGGTLASIEGAASVTLEGGTVPALSNCVVAVPVSSGAAGTYTISAESVTAIENANNTVGTSTLNVVVAAGLLAELPGYTVEQTVEHTVVTSGEPTVTVTDGALPPGLSIDPAGQVTGTPTAAGPWAVQLTANVSGVLTVVDYVGTVAKGEIDLDGEAAPSSIAPGESSTITVTGIPAVATGTVEVTAGGVIICTIVLPAASCASDPSLTAGEYRLQLAYSGDDNWLVGTAAIDGFAVLDDDVALQAALDSETTTFGEPVTVSVDLSAVAPVGVVLVRADELVLCEIEWPAQSTCATPHDLAVGTYAVTAEFAANDGGTYEGASVTVGDLLVSKATVTIAAAQAEYEAPEGEPVVVGVVGIPTGATGDVTITAEPRVTPSGVSVGGGASRVQVRAPAQLVGDGATCRFTVTQTTECTLPAGLNAGAYMLTISYSGDSSYEASTASAALAVIAAQAAPDVPVAERPGVTDEIPSTGAPAAWLLVAFVALAIAVLGGLMLVVSRRGRDVLQETV